MFDIPRIPSFDALHPAVSHFPIALLLIAPLFLLLASWLRRHRLVLAGVALGLMATGTVGVYLAATTGDAARDAASGRPELKNFIAAHEELGSVARATYSVLTGLLAALLLARRLSGREPGRLLPAGLVTLAVLSAAAGLILVNTAYTGALLVHQHGLHAPIR